ncbi:MAG: DNA-formamidopyrimidine glycosylase [Euryarchaeota archaeon]|nr:DNA-formamidopyrimidine glycosylase [Euryarchaeota archaeon]OUW22747.1 MAG: DNA-formamidopyrimidine glycosylase [Euryarchaeota archaeon TMED173]
MPELPEVETVRIGLEMHLLGSRIMEVELRRNDLRFPFPDDFRESLEGCKIISVDRRAKYLLIRLDSGKTWLCHLGMSGRWTLMGDSLVSRPGKFANGTPLGTGDGPHDWVVVYMDNGIKAVYSDHRRFGFMDCFQTLDQEGQRMLNSIGPEPTPDHLTPRILADGLRGKKTPIKSALLDQRIVAGLGNIYVCEILFRSGVSPRRRASSVAGKAGVSKMVERITAATHDVIIEAIDAGGSTLQDFRGVDGDESIGYFIHNFQVYGREGEKCLSKKCPSIIKRILQANRSTFYCPLCQR